MNEWSPSHPAWEMGTYDIHMAELETAAVRDWLIRQGPRPPASSARIKTVLDVGSGSGHWARKMFAGFDCTRCTEYSDDPAKRADIRALPFPDNSFDIVHARRVVSNLAPAERAGAISELCRVARHAVLLVDVFAEPHERVQKLRESLGLPRLPRGLGAGPLEYDAAPALILSGAELTPWVPVGADYYLWTRVFLPIDLDPVPWAHPARTLYPEFHGADKFAVHRMYVIKP